MPLLFEGCSTISYTSQGSLPVSLTGKNHHHKQIAITKKANFFLWGFYPKKHIVLLDQLIHQNGYQEISKVSVKERTTFLDGFMILATFGMYVPRTFEITGIGI